MDVGALLRAARERRGLTLEQVASSTKLSLFVLRSIEGNAWDHLPGGLHIRGHLRAYAAAVGLSPDDVVHAYLEQLPPAPVVETRKPRVASDERRPHPAAFWLAAAAAIVVVIALREWRGAPTQAPATPTQATERVPVPSTTGPSAREPEPANALATEPGAASPLLIAIDITGPCWVSVRADAQLVVYRLMTAGETATVKADEELVLRIGDAATFSFTLNGLPGRSLGAAGQPVTITITRDNIQAFISSAEASRRLHEHRPASS